MKLDKVLLVIAILVIAYALFSRFYGAPCLALGGRVKSSSVLLLGNTILLCALYFKK